MVDPQTTAETAQLAAGGAAGASASVYLRHPGTTVKAVCQGAVSILLASAFGTTAHHYLETFGFNMSASGAVVGLTGLTIAGGLLRGLSKVDFTAFLPKKGA